MTSVNFYRAKKLNIGGGQADSKSLKGYVKIAVWYPLEGRTDRWKIYFSTDVSMSTKDVINCYRARFQLEFRFRDAKSFAGLTNCQARDLRRLEFHFNASREVLFFDTGCGKAVSTSFEEPGFSEELARNLQGDILESQRKYYGGYIHVGKRVFLENLDGFIFASGEDTPDAILDVFSISGKPMERLLLDRSGHCAVDENGGRILLFTYGDNPGLFVYHYRAEQ